MSAKHKTTVGVIFGGRSVEHDVSIVTGHQVMRAFDPDRYEVVPIYIDRNGRWYTGAALLELKNFQNEVASLAGIQTCLLSPAIQHHGLMVDPVKGKLFGKTEIKRLDVVFPTIHGSHGEDGTLQGLLELADIPYAGCGVMASAIANDKLMTKTVLRQHNIPVVDAVAFTRAEWLQDSDAILSRIESTLSYPMFVKPVTLGSSIGIARVNDPMMLRASVDVAANLDRKIMVEAAVTNSVEINCAVLGDEREMRASVLEQPISWEQFLTYEEKYLRGGEGMKSAQRIIPAPISPALTQRIQDIAIAAFKAIDGRGTARIDFLVRPERDEIYLNELNTMPGSLALYLWTEVGLSASAVLDRLVAVGRDIHAEKRRNTYNYQTNLVAMTASRGLKGVKGAKSQQRQPS